LPGAHSCAATGDAFDVTNEASSEVLVPTGRWRAITAAAFAGFAMAAIGAELYLRRPIRHLRDTADQIADGNVATRADLRRAPREVVAIAHAIDRIADRLQSRDEEVAALSLRVLEVQESERKAVARELHDEIGQALTAVKLMLQTIRHQDSPTTKDQWDDLVHTVDRALNQVRSLSVDLRPPMLDHLGLADTLRWYVDREAQRTGLAANCEIEPEDLRLDPVLEMTIFRIAQDALTNVVRHAGASAVHVVVRQTMDTVEVAIIDNGRGFDVDAARERAVRGHTIGLAGMQERATLAGGSLDIYPLQQGTAVRAVLPVTRDAAARA
jgi:signal transduction histidine kinase